MKQKQLELQLCGFELDAIIDLFENESMYRWYPTEIVAKLKTISEDQSVINYFSFSNEYLYYKDDIIQILKDMKSGKIDLTKY